MRARTLLALAAAGCPGPELERSTDLAHVEVRSLELYLGSFTMWGDLQLVQEPDDPCAVLGTDFHARIGKLEISTPPGSIEESCASPTNSQPCIPGPDYCAFPFVSYAWPLPMPSCPVCGR